MGLVDPPPEARGSTCLGEYTHEESMGVCHHCMCCLWGLLAWCLGIYTALQTLSLCDPGSQVRSSADTQAEPGPLCHLVACSQIMQEWAQLYKTALQSSRGSLLPMAHTPALHFSLPWQGLFSFSHPRQILLAFPVPMCARGSESSCTGLFPGLDTYSCLSGQILVLECLLSMPEPELHACGSCSTWWSCIVTASEYFHLPQPSEHWHLLVNHHHYFYNKFLKI